jgi:hypothetical protein
MKLFNAKNAFLALAAGVGLVFSGCSEEKSTTRPSSNNTPVVDPGLRPTKNVRDADMRISKNITWDKDTVYILTGLVFAEEGQTLTIQPGTVIKAQKGSGQNASALIIARGAKIIADGTAAEPIIFTSLGDNPAVKGEDADVAYGEWGGLVILGKASTNNVDASKNQIEGIDATEKRGLYGGTDDNDNSGILRYVSVRHGGSLLGVSNELNGITFGGVGRQTVVEHIEAAYNSDDGVEFFGGTVNVKYLVTSMCQDDGIDWDLGYRGFIQYAFVVQGGRLDDGERGAELDGGDKPKNAEPFSLAQVWNATFIGTGSTSPKSTVAIFRDCSAGEMHNSIFTNFPIGVQIEDVADGQDSYQMLTDGKLALRNNLFWDVANNDTAKQIVKVTNEPGSLYGKAFQAGQNKIGNPNVTISFQTNGTLNPVPGNATEVNGAPAPTEAFLDKVTYRGAFQPSGTNWLKGWTLLANDGYIAN